MVDLVSPGCQKRPTPSEYGSTMHSFANGLRRIYLLGNSINIRQEKKGQDPGSLRCPRVPATSAAIVVESASALDAETPLVGVIAQELTGTFRDALAHCGVVLLYGFQPQTPADEQLYAEGLDQVQRRGDARRMRLVAAEKGIPGVLWSILIFGGVAAVGFTYLFGLENTWAHRLMVVTLAAV